MKRITAFILSLVLIFSVISFDISAANEEDAPVVLDLIVTTEFEEILDATNSNARVSGLIVSYGLSLTKSGSTLSLRGQTYASIDVVTCGFKNLTVQRRKTSDDSWEDYYEYGNVYADAVAANLETTLVVASGYQYRISCKHYAKKNILLTQSISNTSNIVTTS